MRCIAALSLVAALSSCGKEVPSRAPSDATEARPTTELAASAPAPPPATAPAESGPPPFRLAWTQQTPPFHQALSIAPGGDVAVLATQRLSLHDQKSGAPLAERKVCAALEGALDAASGALVCADRIERFALPALEPRGATRLPAKATLASFARGLVAVAFERGPIRVIDVASGAERHALETSSAASSLALSRDGARLAVGLETGEVIVQELGGGARSFAVRRGLAIDALAFSPDGERLFVAAGPHAAVWTTEGVLEQAYQTVGAVSAARWLNGRDVVVAGRDGVLLLGDEGAVSSVDGSGVLAGAPFGLDASSDGLVCAAEREGKVACFSRRTAAVRPVPVDLDPGSRFSATMPGRVVGVNGARVRVQALSGAALPEPGSDVVVLRYLERRIGEQKTAAWVRLAAGRVFKLDGDVVFVRIDSEITPVPGERRPLARELAVRLAWDPIGD